MKRLLAIVFALGVIAFLPATVSANPGPHLAYGPELSTANCDKGKLVINITQKVVNSVDSKVGGGYWAFVDYSRHMKVREVGEDTYCAIVQYQGDFTTIAGNSPSNQGTVSDGISGTLQGGYRIIISGVFDPSMPSQGHIGTFDYACDSGGSCPGAFDWTQEYFPGNSFVYEWWGWIYHGGPNGTWVNASTGNEGDITG